ncbi:Hydroxyacylglutathione hydrolase [Pigmentiphaga humi]|uniref:Hydroxyacylglutathione hydrolase n=1 Tax=Pigmentiphaga humi TaxID=2478468 RepID=A0A3P4B7Z5_9BURK|nr:Hydroxyacylglutathione hydrolase [Pigmentiphaga humi]
MKDSVKQNTRRTQRAGDGPAITGLPAFNDNYLWLVRQGSLAAVVDPGDAAPVLAALQQQRLQLRAILLTHHHKDHVGGVLELVERTGATVFGPANEKLPHCDRRLGQGDRLTLPELDLDLEVLDVPGHTAGHIAYAGRAAGVEPLVFCGDTLFAAGCGRLFEGTPAQMKESLDKLAALPARTRIYCAHEYTLSNLAWAAAVEPDNAALRIWHQQARQLRDQGEPTVPTTLDLERQVNPFLRTAVPEVAAAAAAHAGKPLADETGVFAALRQWKNDFR